MNLAKFVPIITSLLRRFGTIGQLVRQTNGAYDPQLGSASVTLTAQTVRLVTEPYDAEFIDGTMIHVNDLKAFVSVENLEFEPEAGDQLVFYGSTYRVVSVKNYNPTGTPLLYELQVRK